MLAYKFYLHDAIKGSFEFIGLLPERRIDPGRITDESIINWGRKYFAKNVKEKEIFFIESSLKDSEKGFFLPVGDPGKK
jgi:hypothetical protein